MTLFRFVAAVVMLANTGSINAQPVFQWAKQGVSSTTDYGRNIAKDAAGNTYTCGTFSNSITFGTVTLTGSGILDIFLVKYDPLGNVVWAQAPIGSGSSYANAVCVDPAGYVYVTGEFGTSLQFGTLTLTGSPADIFLVKFDQNGNPVWGRTAGGGNAEQGYSVAADLFGNVFITGYFKSGTCNFGNNISLANVSGSSSDFYVAKYDSSGTIQWAQRAGGIYYDMGQSVTTDSEGSAYVTGYFASSTITFGAYTLTNQGTAPSSDLFVTKFDSAGAVVWARGYGTSASAEEGLGITTDSSNSVYVIGNFAGSTIAIGAFTLLLADGNLCLAKISSTGTETWARNCGGSMGMMYRNSIASDNLGNVYVAGSFIDSAIVFSADTLINQDATGTTYDFFLAKYDSSGLNDWAISGGGTTTDYGYGVAVIGDDDFVMMGSFVSPSMTLGTTVLTNSGLYDFFITNGTPVGAGYEEEPSTFGVSVFPNPVSFNATLKVDRNIVLDNSALELFDASGKLVCLIPVLSHEAALDLSGISCGLYIYNLRNSGEIISRGKLIKE